MTFADRSRGYVPRLKEGFEGGHQGVEKCVGNPWSFCNLPNTIKTKCAYPPFSTAERMA